MGIFFHSTSLSRRFSSQCLTWRDPMSSFYNRPSPQDLFKLAICPPDILLMVGKCGGTASSLLESLMGLSMKLLHLFLTTISALGPRSFPGEMATIPLSTIHMSMPCQMATKSTTKLVLVDGAYRGI